MKSLLTIGAVILTAGTCFADLDGKVDARTTNEHISPNGVPMKLSPNGVPIKHNKQSKGIESYYQRGNYRSLGDGDIECACESKFSVGDVVTLLVDNPDGNPDLFAGATGTVLCGDPYDGGIILVDWDNFAGGHDQNNCACNPTDPGSGNSRWWVYCDEIEGSGDGDIECACESQFSVGDTVTLLVDNPDSNADLFAGATGTVLCGDPYDGGIILVEWDNFAGGHDYNNCACNPTDPGSGNSRWWVHCDEIEITLATGACCYTDSDLGWTCTYATEADCLALTNGYWYGSGTTCGVPPVECDLPVIEGACCYTDSDLGWTCTYATEADCLALTNGYWYGSGTTCGVPPVECDLPSDPTGACCSNETCQEISEADCLDIGGSYEGDNTNCADTNCGGDGDIECACESQFSVGDAVTLLVDNPDGNADLFAGATGTVLCGDPYDGGIILVEWDNFAGGHDYNNCACNPTDPGSGNSRWWVHCDEITTDDIPCVGDLNGDGVVNVSDLLLLIAFWGPCP